MEKDALERLSHIQARLEALDQGDLAELERTKRILRGAEVALEDVRVAQAANGWPPGPPLPHLFSFAFSQEFGFGANWSPPLPPNWPPDDGVDAGVDEVEDIVYDTLPPSRGFQVSCRNQKDSYIPKGPVVLQPDAAAKLGKICRGWVGRETPTRA